MLIFVIQKIGKKTFLRQTKSLFICKVRVSSQKQQLSFEYIALFLTISEQITKKTLNH